MTERMQFFFDESGKSDLTSWEESGRPNLIIAGCLVSWKSGSWDDIKHAWEIAADLLSKKPEEVELHGWEIYGGKGQWSGVGNRLQVLKVIFSALKKHGIPVYWSGLPVDLLHSVPDKKWERVLAMFLQLLNDKFRHLCGECSIEVYGDANSWVKPSGALTKDDWSSFTNRQAVFLESSEVHGIQVADVIAHTLHRSNKRELCNTDQKADEFRLQIASQIEHLPGGRA